MTRFYLRDRHGEPLTAYEDILQAKDALDTCEPGTDLVRSADGVLMARKVGGVLAKRQRD